MSLSIYLACECCGCTAYDANITHNLGRMADALGIYDCLWRAPENDYTEASQLIDPLRRAIQDMKADPEKFRAHNAPNGWGLYRHFLPWLEGLLEACERSPNATIRTSR